MTSLTTRDQKEISTKNEFAGAKVFISLGGWKKTKTCKINLSFYKCQD